MVRRLLRYGLVSSIIIAFMSMSQVWAQDLNGDNSVEFEIDGRTSRRINVPFEIVNNLIIIEGRINNSVPLKFILDTGVGKTLITSLPEGEEIYLNSSRTVKLAGLGEGEPVEAFYAESNILTIETVEGRNIEVLFLKEDIFQLSSFMGTNVHGIIGYDLFANFAVEIDYLAKVVRLYDTKAFAKKFRELPKHSKWHKIPIDIQDQKPYVIVGHKHKDGIGFTEIRLLIDSGSSNAFSLYDLTHPSIHIPKARLNSLIGVGLSGNVNGYLGKVAEMKLGDFIFEEPVIAYPDSFAIRKAFDVGDRNGSMGGEVLRRFKVIFHYEGGYMLMRKNKDFRENFEYNKSGIEVNTPIPNMPLYVVSAIREGSPADLDGLEVGDVLKYINKKNTLTMELNEVLNYLQKSRSNRLSIGVQRESMYKTVSFQLEDELKVDQ